MLLHGIMSTIAEFHSRNPASEVVKGMTQKATNDGTVGKAPIGYLNIRTRDAQGREIRTVEIDPKHAPWWSGRSKSYASSDWTLSQPHEELTARSLTSPPTPKRPAKALALSSVHRILTNPYYKGDVTYQDAHHPLMPAEAWYQVQAVLRAQQDRRRRHPGPRPLPQRS